MGLVYSDKAVDNGRHDEAEEPTLGEAPSLLHASTSEEAEILSRMLQLERRQRRYGKRRRIRPWKVLASLVILLIFSMAFLLGRDEIHSSKRQARLFSKLARGMTYELGDGLTYVSVRSPAGPYDRRLGYASLPVISRRLQQENFVIQGQAWPSERMREWTDLGIFPIYREKIQAGLEILDRHGQVIFSQNHPKRIFTSFSEIPPLIVDMLLFIENRRLLDSSRPYLNPAVDWGRLGKATIENLRQLLDENHSAPGGSTLATQLEKFRHSQNGLTDSPREKLRQIVSASFRAYLDGEDTVAARQAIVMNYINSVPLAAFPQYGEIHGLGDGLWAWYGVDLDRVCAALNGRSPEDHPEMLRKRAEALKQVLSLFLAHNRPTDFLRKRREYLNQRCDTFLSLLAKEGIISERLKDQALEAPLVFREGFIDPPARGLVERKSVDAVRTRLLSLLDIDQVYRLDRLDLSVKSTLDMPTQVLVTHEIMKLHDPAWVAEKDLTGPGLLGKGDPSKVLYSFALYERTPAGNVLRVETDNNENALNINEGTKLDLGSTAKLRTLIHYLEIIASLHKRYGGMGKDALLKAMAAVDDPLSRWAVSYLTRTKDRSLRGMLLAAMKRSYSANPNERFFTGSGVHTFENFSKDDDDRTMSLNEAFRRSVNLVFIRLMRDMVRYHMFCTSGLSAEILRSADHERRREYLEKFADFEGAQFCQRFYFKYRGKPPREALELLLESVRPIPRRLAAVYRYVYPERGVADLSEFLHTRLPGSSLGDRTVRRLHHKYDPDKFSVADMGYIARLHPLELWVVSYLQRRPQASLGEILRAGHLIRREVYGWLFRTSHKRAQDKRIRVLLEMEAFERIHKAWKRVGYPFDTLVPSYATAIGSSADRPEALAQLMGIILNGGVRLPTYRVETLHFAVGTPYEVRFVRGATPGERVLEPEIAAVVKEALFDVVDNGTAKRVRRAFSREDDTWVRVGGKTGTGDHRYEVYGRNGQLIDSRVMNRAASFAFILGERFFGDITAYVPGPQAADYRFTSALPVTILKLLAPALMPLADAEQRDTARGKS